MPTWRPPRNQCAASKQLLLSTLMISTATSDEHRASSDEHMTNLRCQHCRYGHAPNKLRATECRPCTTVTATFSWISCSRRMCSETTPKRRASSESHTDSFALAHPLFEDAICRRERSSSYYHEKTGLISRMQRSTSDCAVPWSERASQLN